MCFLDISSVAAILLVEIHQLTKIKSSTGSKISGGVTLEGLPDHVTL